ncbi:3D (Asp-Asp-Asp) domain-containing protein [Lentibacillus halodurans]|uniref:3D (Asp-Asp-Asp) domain-containing protein n=1 Tax=Lentibacillus halodurans TaxID=237679 RepID=A0A1I0X7J9_9BACI|nr:3D domain-containing protein [Lentibacillus halodurans]SFA97012.1 3D (Asp-Asp-Asp) domain-containing protein [Lentibacillus halodurans]
MKKMVASIATGVIIAGASVTTASAAEYTVEKGDSLWEIAQENNTTVDELVDINELENTIIQPDQTLNLHDTYQVQKGDTLIGISEEYDVSVDDLKKWNDLDSDLIVIGQELEIKGVNVEQQDEPVTATVSESSSGESNETEQTSNNTNDANQEQSSQDNPDGKTITVTATAYTADCNGCSGITSTGVDLNDNPNAKVIAVDPNVIPLGSEVYVEGYGYATAADVGGAINGNKIDIHVPTKDEANDWGVRTVDVTIVNES